MPDPFSYVSPWPSAPIIVNVQAGGNDNLLYAAIGTIVGALITGTLSVLLEAWRIHRANRSARHKLIAKLQNAYSWLRSTSSYPLLSAEPDVEKMVDELARILDESDTLNALNDKLAEAMRRVHGIAISASVGFVMVRGWASSGAVDQKTIRDTLKETADAALPLLRDALLLLGEQAWVESVDGAPPRSGGEQVTTGLAKSRGGKGN